MIIAVMVLTAAFVFITFNIDFRNKVLYQCLSIGSLILFTGSLWLLIGNFRYNYGMKQIAKVHTEKITSVSSKLHLLVYTNVGSAKKHDIVAYKTNSRQSRPSHTETNIHTQNRIIKLSRVHAPYLKSTKMYWVYKNHFDSILYAGLKNGTTTRTVNKFYVPKGWLILSVKQVRVFQNAAKKLSKQAKKQSASPQVQQALRVQGQAFVKQQMAETLQKYPTATPQMLKRIMAEATKKYEDSIREQNMLQIMQRATAQAEQSPAGYVD